MLSHDSPDVVIVTSEVLWVWVYIIRKKQNTFILHGRVLSDTHILKQDVTDFVITPRVLGNV